MATALTTTGNTALPDGKPPIVPISVKAALAGDRGWNTGLALAKLQRSGDLGLVPGLAAAMAAASRPIGRDKLVQRLTALGMTMAPNRPAAEASIWVHETARLLADLAEDVVLGAIDTLQKRLKFLPTVAEIRELADPVMERRRAEAAKLDAMARYLRSGQPIPKLSDPKPREPETPITPEEAEEMNALMRSIGSRMRWRGDGSSYQLDHTETVARRYDGPPRTPTWADYEALGVGREVLDKMEMEGRG